MRPSASQFDADQRHREIELAFAYLVGPALLAQRIALDILGSTMATEPAGSIAQCPATKPEVADQPAPAPAPEFLVRPMLRPMLKSACGLFDAAGAGASPP